jgi:hypothetical protein
VSIYNGFILQFIIITTTIPTFNAKYKNTYGGGKQNIKTHTAAKEQEEWL